MIISNQSLLPSSIINTSLIQNNFNTDTVLYSLVNNITFPVTSSLGGYLMYGNTGSVTSSVTVSTMNSTFQISQYGSGSTSTTILSSINGYDWIPFFTYSYNGPTSSIINTNVPYMYFQVQILNTATSTGSVYLLSR